MDIIERIAEQKIREAMERGEFDNLPGKGKPLNLDDDAGIPEDLRMAYRVLKNAGCIPPELELHREVINLGKLLGTVEDGQERRKGLRELNYKLLKINMTRKVPLDLDRLPKYRDLVAEKLSGR